MRKQSLFLKSTILLWIGQNVAFYLKLSPKHFVRRQKDGWEGSLDILLRIWTYLSFPWVNISYEGKRYHNTSRS